VGRQLLANHFTAGAVRVTGLEETLFLVVAVEVDVIRFLRVMAGPVFMAAMEELGMTPFLARMVQRLEVGVVALERARLVALGQEAN
jgi:hypothetical protein